LTHGYSTLRQWDQWLTQHFLGTSLLAAEEKVFSRLLSPYRSKHAVLIGVTHQYCLLKSAPSFYHSMISPLVSKEKNGTSIESNVHDLPILSGSVDLVILPHTFEFIETPRQLISEACRIVKPEGLIAICGFNPYSLWGIKKLVDNRQGMPETRHFIHKNILKNWLQLADFQLEEQSSILFQPPIKHQKLFNKLHFLEQLGSICFPFFGGVYVLIARAKVIPLTPIRLKWKQQLGTHHLPTISGYLTNEACNKNFHRWSLPR
jgi:SAM-dependent methyltransferase